jgi:hypothetical protein
MTLEAVWFKNGKEVWRVDPVLNIVSDEDMKELSEVEVFNGSDWYSSADFDDADDLVIRIKKD